MKVEFTHKFIKIFKKRISFQGNIHRKFDKRTILFLHNPANPILEDHSLTGDLKGLRAFSITGDIRVVYYIKDNVAYFIDIGTHNQVYGK